MPMAAHTDARMILVIAHDAIRREGLKVVLERAGHRVVLAEDAVKVLSQEPEDPAPDLILLDTKLSFDEARRLRATWQLNPSLASVPLLLITSPETSAATAGELGAAGWLRDPVDIGQLIAEVGRCIYTS
jgi:DNA-binding response OmpR family regulator